jgi:broad specificity phosphatase PhoE
MTAYLVRHVKAGSRSDWIGRDELRPVSEAGRRQAVALAARLGSEPIKRIVSSPYTRCVESVQPLALLLGLAVETADALAEGAAAGDAVALVVEAAADNGVVCSHGDVIPAVLDELARTDGLGLDHDLRCAKGSTWILDGATRPFVAARYIGPP